MTAQSPGGSHARQVRRPAKGRRRRPLRQARRDAQERLKGASKSMMSMSEKELEEFAHTKRKGKPEHVDDKR